MIIAMSKNMQEYIRKIKSVFESNRVTLSIIILCTIVEAFIAAVPYNYYEDIDFLVSAIRRVLLYLIIPSLFIETYFTESKVKRVYGYIIAFIIFGAVAPLGDLDYAFDEVYIWEVYRIEQVVGFSIAPIRKCAAVYLGVAFLILSVMILYKKYKDSQLHFNKYIIKVFQSIVKALVIWVILELCYSYTDSFMAENIFHRYYFEYTEQIYGMILILNTFYLGPVGVLIMGFYLGPEVIFALRGKGEEADKIAREIVSVFVLWLIGIVYACFCIFLIEFLSQMQMFSIISALFCLGLPVWIMTGYDTEKSLCAKIISILPYLFAPFIILQIYYIGVGVCQYGMTCERYVGMMFIIFEIGTLYIRHFRKGQYQKLLPFFVLLVIITFFVPGINMNELSDMWQISFLKKYYQAVYDGELTSELAYERLTGSYDYLEYRPEMQEEIEFYDIYDESFAIKLKEQYGEADLTRYDFYMMDCDRMAEDVDVSAYSTVSALKQNSCYINTRGGQYLDIINEDGIDVDYSCFQFIDNETGEMIIADISGFVEKGMAYIEEFPYASKEECSAAMKAYNRIVLDNDSILYINKFDVWYRVGIKNAEPYFAWMTIDIDGILLQK